MNGEWVLVAEKMLQASDLNTNQNRLLLRRCDAQQRILPLLRQSELEAVMGSNGGLNVEISTANCDRVFEVQFKHWGSSKGFIFNGRGWRNLRSHFNGILTEGNILRFYCFGGDGEGEGEGEGEGGRERKLQMRMVVVQSSEMMKAADSLVSFRQKLPTSGVTGSSLEGTRLELDLLTRYRACESSSNMISSSMGSNSNNTPLYSSARRAAHERKSRGNFLMQAFP